MPDDDIKTHLAAEAVKNWKTIMATSSETEFNLQEVLGFLARFERVEVTYEPGKINLMFPVELAGWEWGMTFDPSSPNSDCLARKAFRRVVERVETKLLERTNAQ